MPGNFTVTAYDPYGNVATGYSGTVQFTSSDSQAVLPGNYTIHHRGCGRSHLFSHAEDNGHAVDHRDRFRYEDDHGEHQRDGEHAKRLGQFS